MGARAPRLARATASLLAAAAVGWTGACASQGAPTGGPADVRPPVVIGTEPDAYAVLEDLDDKVRFHFDERVSENVDGGVLDRAVLISPQTGAVHVSHGSRSLTVEIEGGFRPGLVYRVTLLSVVRDLFGNTLRDPFELVFSTGGVATPTTVAGQVWDRLTGRGVNGAFVRALGMDSLPHVAQTDEEGIYALRYLPPGAFELTAFVDRNRDGELGSAEAQGTVPASVAAGDTLYINISVLAPDTTPAVVLRARLLDSVTVVIEFDDYLDPEVSADRIGVRLTREEGDAPLVERLFHENEYDDYVDQVADSLLRLDSLDAAARPPVAATPPDSVTVTDTVPPTVTVPGATDPDSALTPVARRPPPRLQLGRRTGLPGGQSSLGPESVLPGQRVVGQLDGPLEPGVEYQLRLTDVVNINGLPQGGGDATLLLVAPVPDTTAVPPDTVSAAGGPPPRRR